MKIKKYEEVDMRELMLKNGLTFKRLSELTGLDPAYLCRVANNKQNISQTNWDKIKKHL